MEKQAKSTTPKESVRVEVHEDTLVCKHTPAGLWICCSERQPDSCALGLTPVGAAANWERAQHSEE